MGGHAKTGTSHARENRHQEAAESTGGKQAISYLSWKYTLLRVDAPGRLEAATKANYGEQY